MHGMSYSREALASCAAAFQQSGKIKLMVPDSERSSPDRISHEMTALRMEGDELVAEVTVLDTPAGKVLDEMLKSGKAVLAPRGPGKRGEDDVVTEFRIDNLSVYPWDLVSPQVNTTIYRGDE